METSAMNNKLPILSLALAVLTASILASPVRDADAAKSLSFIEDAAPVNLWVWPEEMVRVPVRVTPNLVWTPETGVWYGAIAANGYCNATGSAYGEFTQSSVTTTYLSGYSVGTFLSLDPGHYVLG